MSVVSVWDKRKRRTSNQKCYTTHRAIIAVRIGNVLRFMGIVVVAEAINLLDLDVESLYEDETETQLHHKL